MPELTNREVQNIRVAIRVLVVRHGGLAMLASRTGMSDRSLKSVLYGMSRPGAKLAIGIARAAGVSVEDVLDGTFPGAGVCRHCGHATDEPPAEETPDVH